MRNYIKKGFLVLGLNLLLGMTFGQQLPVYSQYMMNMFLINPAVAGADGYQITFDGNVLGVTELTDIDLSKNKVFTGCYIQFA